MAELTKRMNFKKIRSQHGTQRKVAEETGVTETTIRNIERGRSNPSFELSIKLSKIFEIKFEELWEEDF